MYEHTSFNILKANFPHALLLLPPPFDDLGVERNVFLCIVFDGNVLEVIPDLASRRVVLRPIRVCLKRGLVRMRRTVMGNQLSNWRGCNRRLTYHKRRLDKYSLTKSHRYHNPSHNT
jgi:hypothetical protein